MMSSIIIQYPYHSVIITNSYKRIPYQRAYLIECDKVRSNIVVAAALHTTEHMAWDGGYS